MRLFYAIELDEATRKLLVDVQTALKQKAVRANFSQAGNLHLTLRFMGEVEPGHLEVLKRIQEDTAAKFKDFSLELSSPGAFERGHKSIVWWGLKKNEQLFSLQRALEAEIRANGFTPELKPYSPHVTLAREFVGDVKNILSSLSPIQHQFHVPVISLMESTRVEGRLTYLSLYRSQLLSD